MDYAAAIAAILQAAGSIGGMVMGDVDREKAKALLEQTLGRLGGVSQPDLTQYTQGDSAFGGAAEDPQMRGYQQQALEQLAREVQYGGMTPEDRAAYDRARAEAGSIDNGMRGAAAQQMASRGMAGSMADYAATLQGGQAATNRAAMMGTEAAADSRQRYLKALDMLGSGASGVRAQDWDVASDRARAQDSINQFNAGQLARAAQQQFANQMGVINAQGNARGDIASMYSQAGDRSERRGAAAGGAAGDFAQGLWAGYGNQQGGGQSNNKDDNDYWG